METERITQKALDSLPEYSKSLPTGTFRGKVWKRDANWDRSKGDEAVWIIGEYVGPAVDGKVKIEWRSPVIIPEK